MGQDDRISFIGYWSSKDCLASHLEIVHGLVPEGSKQDLQDLHYDAHGEKTRHPG